MYRYILHLGASVTEIKLRKLKYTEHKNNMKIKHLIHQQGLTQTTKKAQNVQDHNI